MEKQTVTEDADATEKAKADMRDESERWAAQAPEAVEQTEVAADFVRRRPEASEGVPLSLERAAALRVEAGPQLRFAGQIHWSPSVLVLASASASAWAFVSVATDVASSFLQKSRFLALYWIRCSMRLLWRLFGSASR